jgi:hypothetical protein
MTACLPLQHCIVQTPDYKTTGLRPKISAAALQSS